MTGQQLADMRRLRRLTAGLLAGFCLVAAALVFWSMLRTAQLSAREDNPRRVEAALRVQRGQILDRGSQVLAETVGSGRALRRVYTAGEGAPAIGYYSFRHGTAGVEQSFDAILSGVDEPPAAAWQRELLHQPRAGRGVQTTLDAGLQQLAARLLRPYQGSLVLLDINQRDVAAVLAMASYPAYDPNLLDEQFEQLIADARAPLLNRAAQGRYQPGLLLQPFLWAAAYERGLVVPDEAVGSANRPVPVNGSVMRCATTPPAAPAWRDVLQHRCPGPMQDLADQLGAAGVEQAFDIFGLLTPPELPLETETPPSPPLADLRLAAVGQENLTVTPLQVALALAALAADGRFPQLQLVSAVQDRSGAWQPLPLPDAPPETVVSAQTARTTRDLLSVNDGIREHAVRAFSGPGASTSVWYMGLFPVAAPRYLLVLVLEEQESLDAAIKIGRDLLQATADE